MTGNDQLVEQLSRLEESDFVSVVEEARRKRMSHRPPAPDRPKEFNRDALARWYATRHLAIEPYIREVVYLPANAPGSEIRLLEVNVRSNVPDDAPLEPIDFRADSDLPGEHQLFVADITPGQWERVKAGTLALPAGWVLAGNQVFGRKR